MGKTIVFKIWKFPQLSETFVINQIVIAVKLGYDVKILVGEVQDFEENSNLKIIERYGLREKIIPEVYEIPKSRFFRVFKGFFLLLSLIKEWNCFRKFYKFSEKKELTLIFKFNFYRQFSNTPIFHIQFGTNKHPIDILKKSGLLKGKIIVSFHGHDLYFPINKQIPNNGYYDLLFETADYLICNTPFLKEKLSEIDAPASKIITIPVVVDTNLFIPSPQLNEPFKFRLITIGRVDELKGQKYGVYVTKILNDKGYNVEYLIGGNGLYFEKIKNLIFKMGLEDKVTLIGKVSPGNVVSHLQSSDVFLMTSVKNSEGMEESQGLVIAEAQACGLPVVAFDSGGIKYTLKNGETGFLCEEKDIGCFVSKIEQLILSENLRNRMRQNAIDFIEQNFSENSVIEKWKNVYE